MNNDLGGFPTAVKTEVLSLNKSSQSELGFIRKRFRSFFNKVRPDLKYLLFAIPIITTFLLIAEFAHWKGLNSKAGLHSASLSFQLQNWSLPPEHTFGVWINSDYWVGYADMTISFDPSLVKMTREASPSGSLGRMIKITPMSEANSTGKLRLILGLDPSQKNTAPSQAFQIANLTFNANTTRQNVTTSISFNPTPMQIVATDQSVFGPIAAQTLNLTINPLATPISNPIISTPTPILLPTSTPRPTTTPLLSPKPTPKPTIRPL